MKKYLFPLFLIVILLSTIRCTFKQEVTFNEDFSGNYEFSMDMGGMGDYLKDSTGNSTMDTSEFSTLVKEMEKTEGISNAYYKLTDEKFAFGMDFNDVKNLNEATQGNTSSSLGMGMMGDDKAKDHQGLIIKRKKNKITVEETDFTSLKSENKEENMYMSMFEFEYVFHFPKKVKKCNNSHAVISEDGKTITLKGNFEEFIEGDKTNGMVVKLHK